MRRRRSRRTQPRRRVKVWHAWRSDRETYVLRWRFPGDHQTRQETIDAVDETDAIRQAALKQADLEEGTEAADVTWEQAHERFADEKLAFEKPSSRAKNITAMNSVARLMEPHLLCEVDTSFASQYAAKLRQEGRATATVAGYLRELNRFLTWADDIWPGFEAPTIRKPKLPKRRRMRGRPITGEEFDRMLKVVPDIVGQKYAAGWRHFLVGLYLSGLRLNEAAKFCWESTDGLSVGNLSDDRPLLRMPHEDDKGCQDRWLPIARPFVEFLRRTDPGRRRGRVFNPRLPSGRVDYWKLGKTVSAIGKKAKVITKTDPKTDKPKEWASAQDLRRAFGTYWARRVEPIELMSLMRHESIETTMLYYVDIKARDIADATWQHDPTELCDHLCDQIATAATLTGTQSQIAKELT